MTRQTFTPDEDVSGLHLYESPTFGPVTSRLNIQVVVDTPTGVASELTLETSIDNIHWDVVRSPDGVALNPIALDRSKLLQFAIFGRLFRLKGTRSGTTGTLEKIVLFHD